MPVKRSLPPVLVAKVYSQPIIEEMPHYMLALDVDNSCTISNARCDVNAICNDNYNDGMVTFDAGYDWDDRHDCHRDKY